MTTIPDDTPVKIIAALIAERDEWKTFAIKAEDDLAALRAERDKLKDMLAAYREAQAKHVDRGARIAQLVERVIVLEGALRHILSTDSDGNSLSYQSIDATARAALRTSEEA
jgi:hypothetical protein